MTVLLPLLIGAIAGGLLGLCAGWLARGREEVIVEKVVTQTAEKIVPPTADDAAGRRDQASEILAQLQRLTSGVSARIDAHARTVGDISDDLTGAPAEADVVVAAIQRLVESNTTMQSQLQVAQLQLAEQAHLLEARQEEAHTDPLTWLRNRRAFDRELARRIEQCAAQRSALSLMMLDVDHFKKCNDTYGHPAGDEVLRMVGRLLADGVERIPGAFAARYGGEEFALLFSGNSLAAAAQLGEEIRRKIEQAKVDFDGRQLQITASGGAAHWQPGESAASFIARADEALYAAKELGRNCSCLHDRGSTRKLSIAASPGLDVAAPSATAMIQGNDELLSKAIHRRIAQWRRGGVKLSLIVGRLDNLEDIDVHDIARRDRALRQMREFLQQMLREMDEMAPLAGELFGILLPAAPLAEAVRIAERMRCAVLDGALGPHSAGCASLSIGVAEVMEEDDANSLLLRARRAMEAARRRSGNAVYFNDGVYSTSAQDVLDTAAS
jgi:diguanylate cyclase